MFARLAAGLHTYGGADALLTSSRASAAGPRVSGWPFRERDQDEGNLCVGEGGLCMRGFLGKDSPCDSDGTFFLSFHGQAASGVDFVRADTEEHDYIQLTAA
ncbi:hypothetical protein MHYP_G00225180 [Metynnis hypsauchen]